MLRSQLYVPANDERKVRKSATLDSDSIIFDLEDAVPEDEKAGARKTLKRLLNELEFGDRELGVRVNRDAQEYSSNDIEELKSEAKISFLVLPKAENALNTLAESSGKKLMPLIETPRGLLRVEEIVRSEGLMAIGYGAADFANSVEGQTRAYMENIYVKSKLVVAARAYGVAPVDNVFFDLADLEGFRREALHSRELGFVGKQVIHPSQIQIANEVYSPTPEEIEQAKRTVAAYDNGIKSKTGALRLNEKLIDAVHYRQAKNLLSKVEEKS